ncbi:MAG: aldo/keto reductase [Candidatus Thermoplasmatota archaeon]|nr:aldo/keto reductase [Candidatus Thermoplasmatota archaeon]MCL5963500.1 aldo/keto reductase [Candidatus Thermoplasmatota archaeon]
MKYITIGKTGVYSSIMALGAMTFGETNSWKLGGLNQEIVTKMVKKAIDYGINLFDTADVYDYGESEKTLGIALKGYRDKVLIATKVRGQMSNSINDVGLSRYHIKLSIKESLRRLDTSWVDIYQLHGWDSHVPLNETIETMQDLVEDGLVNYPGVSNLSAWQIATINARCEERGYSRYETAQMNYSLLNRDIEHEVIPYLNYSGMTLMAWSPLHGGILTGKYGKDGKAGRGTRMGDRGYFFPFFDQEKGYVIVDTVKEVAEEQGVKPSQIALAWLIARKLIIIIGARTMEQFEENLASLDIQLTREQIKKLDEISSYKEMYPNWMIRRQNSSDRDFHII